MERKHKSKESAKIGVPFVQPVCGADSFIAARPTTLHRTNKYLATRRRSCASALEMDFDDDDDGDAHVRGFWMGAYGFGRRKKLS